MGNALSVIHGLSMQQCTRSVVERQRNGGLSTGGEVSHQPAEQALPAVLDEFTHETNTHASKTFLKKYANATMIADTNSSNMKLPR